MEILLSQRSVNRLWDARDRAVTRAAEHVVLTGPSAKEAELCANQPGCRARSGDALKGEAFTWNVP
jgi:hypothetical protein